jgi:hypothetical protein
MATVGTGYKEMMAEVTKMQAEAAQPVAGEFQQVVDLYAPGGKYGEGALARIKQGQQTGVAGTMDQLVSSGMSSGALAAGVRSRYQREAETQMKQVEDTRYQMLGTALASLAAAREARGIRMSGAFQSAAQLIQAYKGPQDVANIQGKYGLQEQDLVGAYGMAKQTSANQSAMALQTSQQNFDASQNALYKNGKYNNSDYQTVL